MKSFCEFYKEIESKNEGFASGFATTVVAGALAFGAVSLLSQPSTPTQLIENSELLTIAKYIETHEGSRLKAYDDGKGNLTIGVGHKLTRRDIGLFKQLFNKNINPKDISLSITKEEATRLFAYDLKSTIEAAKVRFSNFDSFTINKKSAIIDAIYRGDMGQKTSELINQERWKDASKEYLNHAEYKNYKKNGKMQGVVKRMERNSNNLADTR